jgi:AbrB family looped-hinge helix DNA binding protein
VQLELTGQHKVFRARVDSSGRIVIPAESRLRKQVKEGDLLVVEEDDEGFRIKTLDDAILEAQAYFQSVIPKGVSLVDELIAERRAETARE